MDINKYVFDKLYIQTIFKLQEKLDMISYKKITKENSKELTTNTLRDIFRIDTLTTPTVDYDFKKYSDKLNEYVTKNNKTIYLIKHDKTIIGAAIGGRENAKIFTLDSIVVDSRLREKGIGTKFLFHIVADVRANTNYEYIDLVPLEGTKEILKKLVGKRKVDDKKVREFRTTKFRYSLEKNIGEITRVNLKQKPVLPKQIINNKFRSINTLKNKPK